MNAWNPPSFLGEEFARLQAAAGSGLDDAAVARELLVAYGRCVVHDVPVEEPAAIPPGVAILGAGELVREIEVVTAGIGTSVDRWRDADSQFESDAIIVGLLELRMEAWYAAEALERLAERTSYDARARLETTTNALDAAAHAYSVALEDSTDVLSTVAGTPLLRNWRAMLPARHDPLPWWLDGTLEAAALDLGREFDRSIGAWRPRLQPKPVPRAVAVARASDASLRRASAALAAYAPNLTMNSIEWTLPGTPLRVRLYHVASGLKAGEPLLLELEDTTGGDAAFDAIGSVSFLNGNPVHWRLAGSADRPEVTASWTWGGEGQLSDARTLQLLDGGTGAEWVLAGAGA